MPIYCLPHGGRKNVALSHAKAKNYDQKNNYKFDSKLTIIYIDKNTSIYIYRSLYRILNLGYIRCNEQYRSSLYRRNHCATV